jgi:hypothetical protein
LFTFIEIKTLLEANSMVIGTVSRLPPVPSAQQPYDPDFTVVEKMEEAMQDMSLRDTSEDASLGTINNKLHYMSMKDNELQSRDPKKEELHQIIYKGRLGVTYEQKHNNVGRKISLLPMGESISLTEKDFEENSRDVIINYGFVY